MKNLFLLSIMCISFLFIGCGKKDTSNDIVVIVQYKTQPNKSIDAITSLKRLIEEVKKEDHFVSIKLHVDQSDNSNILLYEVWDNEQYYKNQHMQTEHLKNFIVEAQSFLAGPPEITYWKMNAVYK